jgi:hypothetical protein
MKWTEISFQTSNWMEGHDVLEFVIQTMLVHDLYAQHPSKHFK